MQNDFSNHPYLGIGASNPRRTETIEPKKGVYKGNVLEFKEVVSEKPGQIGRVFFIITMSIEEVITSWAIKVTPTTPAIGSLFSFKSHGGKMRGLCKRNS